MSEFDMQRNNLDRSGSPYLLQHVSNPVWWQEWSVEVIAYAHSVNKPLLVSVGYATCHWCHVMASEAFSDAATADFLNDHFICIKVDREQRPDIDQYMMDFINKQNGRGGWPLNVFLTPSLVPVFALTYAPEARRRGMYSFIEVAEQVLMYTRKNESKIPPFLPQDDKPSTAEENSLIRTLSTYYDPVNGGFGTGQKFPVHCTLLYLLYNAAVEDSPSIKTMCIKTLDSMRLRGLNDHLQGGIFRYCVDSEWTVPHFEKMLYDQAMALWTYSLAHRVTGRAGYREMAMAILKCLEESFEQDGFFITAHDADTGHVEGATYLWGYSQLESELGPDDLAKLEQAYYLPEEGNFDGKIHLIRYNDHQMKQIEDKLLMMRKRRQQPSADDKIICGLNALAAMSLIQAGRFLDLAELSKKAALLTRHILDLFWDGNILGHSYRKGILQNQGFLSDAAFLLAALSFLFEDDSSWEKDVRELEEYVKSFSDGTKWMESRSPDFRPVYASWFDHPFPSSSAMAEFALTRVTILSGNDTSSTSYLQPFQSDFSNITSMIRNGQFHLITSPEPLPWNSIPENSIQIRGKISQDCFMGTCSMPDFGHR